MTQSSGGSRALVGSRLAVSFANVPAMPGDLPSESLSWEDLIGFLEAARIISAERGAVLLDLTQSEPQTAQMLLQKAVRLRSALRQIFRAMVRKEPVGAAWVQRINEVLQITEGHDEVIADGDGWRIEFVARENGLEWLLAAIARSGAELLAGGADSPIRSCANPACGLFFYDTSRTHKRRWCSMSLCGNRSKVAAFAKRRQSKTRAASAGT